MNSLFRNCMRAACALPLIACDRTPTAPARESTDASLAPALSTAGVAPTSEELAGMPSEFHTAPSVFNARTVVGFVPGSGVFAQAFMDYYGTDAEQDVTLTLRSGDRAVYTKTATAIDEHWIPLWSSLTTSVSFAVGGDCGYSADGQSRHRAFHKFIVGGWKFFSWGRYERSSGDDDEQPACSELPPPTAPEPDPGPGPGDGPVAGDVYRTECESCQQWFWYEGGQIVDEWWDCVPVDAWRCNLET